MLKGILPDVQLPFDNGKEILQQNWDFIARYYLCEYYEGGIKTHNCTLTGTKKPNRQEKE